MRCWNRYRGQGTIFDFGCTDSVGPELGKGLRHLIGALPVAAPKLDSWTVGQLDKWPPGTSSLHGWIAKRMICELQSKHGFTHEHLLIKANLAWVSSFLAPATSPETRQATARENP
jgi:hypothetical protein